VSIAFSSIDNEAQAVAVQSGGKIIVAGGAVSRGETLEQARKSVNLDEFRKQITGDSRVRKAMFANYVAFPAVSAAYGEASARR